MRQRKLFCEYGPFCYRLSLKKENLRRTWRDSFHQVRFAQVQRPDDLPVLLKGHRSPVERRLEGVDARLQRNKTVNLKLALPFIDGLLLRPGETFSFWQRVGNPTAKRGFLPGLVIKSGAVGEDIGGGLCQLANMIHWLCLHSPLTVCELHHHSDALFPDSARRVPFGTGTSILYKAVDYRLKNDTAQSFQLRLWLSEGDLCGELRAERPLDVVYRIEETGSHYEQQGEKFFRCSEIWRVVSAADTRRQLHKELLLKNRSLVLYDPSLIPPEEIWRKSPC
ncbi:MAG: VanW family protein [Oscillospiraceae bacterium]|nr:VanW family protein [Oscillospiraceae bacterium]